MSCVGWLLKRVARQLDLEGPPDSEREPLPCVERQAGAAAILCRRHGRARYLDEIADTLLCQPASLPSGEELSSEARRLFLGAAPGLGREFRALDLPHVGCMVTLSTYPPLKGLSRLRLATRAPNVAAN